MREPKVDTPDFLKEKATSPRSEYSLFLEKYRLGEITREEMDDCLVRCGDSQERRDAFWEAEDELAEWHRKRNPKKEKRFLAYRCPECGSSQSRYRSKTNTYKCYQCGHEWLREDLKKS